MRAIQFYVGTICGIAAFAVATADWSAMGRLPAEALLGFMVLTFIGVASESLALNLKIGNSSGNSSITFIPLLACAVLFGPAPTALFIIVTGIAGEFGVRKKEPIRGLFNVSQWTLAALLGGYVFLALGGVPLGTTPNSGGDLGGQLVPFAGFAVTFLVLIHVFVATAIAISQEIPFRRVWGNLVGRAGTNLASDILISPLALFVAFSYLELQIVGLGISLLPLLFVRHSYLTKLKLQQANADLLRALVKAIEVRDPYTSGHSLRVSSLARNIAEKMGLAGHRVAEIETAALLHDIGKIDAVYSDILRKSGSLSAEERQVIESHVTKGVEMLKSLSSFGRAVLDAVRYHHERIDGRGYPEGLRGEEIPIGARIIKVCDAIDAMLSDRPYRSALALSDVKEQLRLYAGSQFDVQVVDVVRNSTILEDHAGEVLRTGRHPASDRRDSKESLTRSHS